MKRSLRIILQKIHLWVGLALCVPIVLIGLSGSALLIQREILAASTPSGKAIGEHAPLAHVVEVARRHSDREPATIRVILPVRDNGPVTVQLAGPGRGNRALVIHLDPVSAEILAAEEAEARGPIMRFLVNMHAFLMLSPPTGLPTVGVMGLVTLFMSITGLILWWPRMKNLRRVLTISRGAHGFRLHWDLHHVVGFWSLLVMVVISFTGVYLCFPQSVSAGIHALMPTEQQTFEPSANFVAPTLPMDADKAVAAALTAVSDARPVAVSMPGRNNVPYVVEMVPVGFEPKAPPIFVSFDSETGGLAYVDDPRTYVIGNKVLNWQHALHFAIGFGWFWELLVFLSGLVPLALAVTGISMWWVKRRKRLRKKVARRQPVAIAATTTIRA